MVASGHTLVSEVAAEVLKAGGNAFDAVTAAGFASAVVEPALNSLGGGGFLLGHSEDLGQKVFFDFFVDTPGKGMLVPGETADFFSITVNFGGSTQDFNVGMGSVAVPGNLKGFLHIHRRLGRMGLAEVLAPAVGLAREHPLNKNQHYFITLLRPILTLNRRGAEVYEPGGNSLCLGEMVRNQELADFIDSLSKGGEESFYRGELAEQIVRGMAEKGGLVTRKDLASYEVKEKKPLAIPYRDRMFYTAAEPSMGGTLIGLSLSLLSRCRKPDFSWGSARHLLATHALMSEVERLRRLGITRPEKLEAFLRDEELVLESDQKMRLFSRGTTHISIADSYGNCASMTCSNGEGSGYIVPGTGVMLNNMMGEDDLHPGGFHTGCPGERVFSMMSPSLLARNGEVELVLGSGGSKRIRTAISQVLSQIVDFKRELRLAVESPRLYLDEDCLQVEPGFAEEALQVLDSAAKINRWSEKNMYFGGVHAVIPGKEGAGDSRRGGAVVVV